MSEQLQLAIEALYRAFASVPKPRKIEGCPCCIDDKNVHTLLTKPLRELTPKELSPYACSVFYTVGDEADFRYFLPRIVEILVTESSWWPDAEVAGKKLPLAQWSKWPASEREAIVRVFELHFEALIAAADGGGLDSWLCGFGCAEIPLRPFLDKITTVSPAVLALYLENANAVWERKLSNSFWEDAPRTAIQEMVDWFYSAQISRLIMDSYGLDLHQPH